MHTCFFVKPKENGKFKNTALLREKDGFLAFNSALEGFTAAVKEVGRLFEKITVAYDGGEISTPCSFVSARAVSDDKAELNFKAEFSLSSAKSLTSVSFVSENGKKINEASFPAGTSASGRFEVFAAAYFTKSGNVNTCAEGFCELVCGIFGVKEVKLTADFANAIAENKQGRLAVYKTVSEEGITLSFTPNGVTEAKYAVIYADGLPAVYIEAQSKSVSADILSVTENVIEPTSFNKEISLIADSAVNLSDDVKTREVAMSVLGKERIRHPFIPSVSRAAASGENLVVSAEGGFVIFKKNGDFYPVNPFIPETRTTSYKDFCLSGNYLFVLDGKLKKFELKTGKLVATYDVNYSADRVFDMNRNRLLFCGTGGFMVANSGSGVTAVYSVSISGGRYAFDPETSVLTVFLSGEIRQYLLGNSSCNLIASYTGNVGITENSYFAGRYKKAFISANGAVRMFDLHNGTVENEYLPAAKEVIPDGSGTYFAAAKGGSCDIYRYDNDFKKIAEVAEKRLLPVENGFVSANGFYPFGEVAKRFEIHSSAPSGNYTVCKETPYFEDESIILTVKGVV